MSSSSQAIPLRCPVPANRSSTVLLWQSFSSQPHGSDSTSPSRCHSWLGFAHRLDLRTGQRFITLWNTWQAPPALRSRIDEARVAPTCCRAKPMMRIGEIAVHCNQRLVHSCCTTRHLSCGSRRCRRLQLSTAEAEYYSASTAGTEILYLRALLERLAYIAQKAPTPVYEDNTACIEWGNNVIGGRERAKHIDIRKHFAPEVIRNGEMKLIKVSTTSQLPDILTKGLHLPQFLACVNGILGVDKD
jgi:hypothetical protein